jgi:hypothetical protein
MSAIHNWTLILSNEAYKKSKQNKDETRVRLESFFLLMIEADLLLQINLEDLIKDFADMKCRGNVFKV